MCEFGFGWPGLDAIFLYNMGLPWFAAGALGAGAPAKALAMRRIWGMESRRLVLASLSAVAVFGVVLVWFPSGPVVWLLVRELTGNCLEWCGWLLLSACIATALDAAVLRFAFHRRIAALSVPACWLFGANLVGLAAGYAVAIWYAIHHPAVA